jgi:hypothetical protein
MGDRSPACRFDHAGIYGRMNRTATTPQLLHDFLEVHAIGAGAPGGAGLVRDQSIDRDHSEVRIDGTYDLSEVARELNTIDDTGTTHGVKQGVRRLLIVAAVLWFGYWSIVVIFALQDYRRDMRYYTGDPNSFGAPSLDPVYGPMIAAFGLPIIAYVVFLTLRWIWRGFRGNGRA